LIAFTILLTRPDSWAYTNIHTRTALKAQKHASHVVYSKTYRKNISPDANTSMSFILFNNKRGEGEGATDVAFTQGFAASPPSMRPRVSVLTYRDHWVNQVCKHRARAQEDGDVRHRHSVVLEAVQVLNDLEVSKHAWQTSCGRRGHVGRRVGARRGMG
jgi:hypothetical protein